MRILISCIVMIFLPLQTAHAVGVHRWVAYGYGNDPCAKLLLAVNSTEPTHVLTWQVDTYYPESVLYMEWIKGYITGVNAMAKSGSARITTDDDKIETWVRSYCSTHPDTALKDAVGEFVKSQLAH